MTHHRDPDEFGDLPPKHIDCPRRCIPKSAGAVHLAPEREQLAFTIAEAMWGREAAESYSLSGFRSPVMCDLRWQQALCAADAVMSRYSCPTPQRPSRLYRDDERYSFLEPG